MSDPYGSSEQNELYKHRFRSLSDYPITGSYLWSYEQERGRPRYTCTTKVVSRCEQNGIRLNGYPLLWGEIRHL